MARYDEATTTHEPLVIEVEDPMLRTLKEALRLLDKTTQERDEARARLKSVIDAYMNNPTDDDAIFRALNALVERGDGHE